MKKIIIVFIALLSSASLPVNAQEINYDFGKESDVLDSVKYVVDWYKKQYKTDDIKKLNLYITIDYCSGYLDIHISQFADADENMKKLTKRTNRFVRINKALNLPVLFDTDILSINDRAYINVNGYYIKAEKNDKYVWRVALMNPTF